VVKKSSHSRKLSVYSNLSHSIKTRKDTTSRKRAQYLATLPKHPVKRLLYRLHPKRFWGYWFSKRGAFMALKIAGISVLLLALLVGGLFAYFRKDLDAIRPEELAKRVQSTVTTYYDRNNVLLWEDKGDDNYKLVVKSDELSDNLKNATVAIEDKDFYTHAGVSIPGLTRAFFNNLSGDSIQGGSTLTQQLVKQVFFPVEALDRSLGGIPRKIKELILSIEVERMYNKDQILTLYLNESPYGGRRNGAESGAQSYFGVSAKDLTIAQASLLAAIPQNPTVYDPYKVSGHEALISRQHTVINNMVEQGMISRADADAAKEFPILDSIKPESTKYENIKAPHFVQMVKSQLESELGKVTVGRGGLTIKTTLDWLVQEKLEEAMATMFKSSVPVATGFTNSAATVADSQTGQIVALMGSRDFKYAGYGQDNAATAYIQPGSTVKPLVYAQLFQQKPAGQANYGSGSILKDEEIDAIYGAKLRNADGNFKGDIPIRISLATSRNIPAAKAMAINEAAKKGSTIATIHDLGAASYCTQGDEVQVGLAASIGGCGIKQVDLVNAYTALARGGIHKEQSTVLEVKNNSGEVLKKWTDDTGTRIIDTQAAYIVNDILTDRDARATFANTTAMNIPGVKTATKTGTSDKGGKAKDIWMMSYSPALTMGVWFGNPDTTILRTGNSLLPGPIIQSVMEYAHKTVYAGDGRWKSGDWFSQPAGLQKVGKELYPAWWNRTQGQSNAKVMFDKVSKFKATACTPEGAKIELNVTKSTDPVTKKDIYTNIPDGYDGSKDDDKHLCTDVKPSTPSITVLLTAANTYTITVTGVSQGTFPLTSVAILVGGNVVSTITAPGPYTYSYVVPISATAIQTVTATVTDQGYYTTSGTSTTSIPPHV